MNEFNNGDMADMNYVYGATDGTEMDALCHGCIWSSSQTDVSQVTFCLENCTTDWMNKVFSKYVDTSVENVLHARLS